ncbi:methyl-accepting chemotaxis protein, partial [Azohydromonas lata]|uniref:methyl-accepting chemotaxis protein n=1 Tax=Azohydromonas lata TaxID=45677 RepID=UPI000A8D779C
MSNFKLSTRLFLGFGLVLALLAVIVGTSAWQMSKLADNSNYYAVNLVPSFQAEDKIGINLGNLRRFEYRHILSNSASQMDELEAKIDRYRKELYASLDLYAKDLLSDDEDKRLLQQARTAIDAYQAIWDGQLKPTSRQTVQDPAKMAQATAIATGPSAKAYEEAHEAVRAWFDYNIKLSDDQAKVAASAYSTAKAQLFVLAALAAALGIAAAVIITKSITRPLGQAVQVAQAVAAGDLNVRIDTTAKDETGQLLAALKDMAEKLSQVVGTVRNGSDSVATASAEIAQGNQDLSGRTEEQASALEETAATMEQLGSTVRHNADSAAQANQLAQAAAGVALQGGNVVNEVVSTMQGISESSRKIG